MGLGPYVRGFLGVMGRGCLTGLGLDGRGCLFGVPLGRVISVSVCFCLDFAVVFGREGRANKRGGKRELIAGGGHMFWSWSVVAMGIVCTGI